MSALLCALFTVAGTYVGTLFTVAGTYVTLVFSLVGFLRLPRPDCRRRARAAQTQTAVVSPGGGRRSLSRGRTRIAKFWRLRGEGQEAGAPHERGAAPDCGVPANATHNNLELEPEPRDLASLVSTGSCSSGVGVKEELGAGSQRVGARSQ